MNRRPSPDTQMLAAMRSAKASGLDADEALRLAVGGQVCDSYAGRRGTVRPQQQALDGPPNLRPAEAPTDTPTILPTDAQKRCAGCRHVLGAGTGVARCGLYEVPVFAGVLWPHLTDERREWKAVIHDTAHEWRAAYLDEPTPVAEHLDVIASALRDAADVGEPERPMLAA